MPGGAPNPKELGRYMALAQVGLEMAAPIALGAALDYWLGWMPWTTVGGAVLGLVGGMAHLIAILNQRDNAQTPRQRDKI